MTHTLIILNPMADKGRAGATIPAIEAELAAHNLDATIVLTERPWHAAELATQAARDGVEVVVAAGGDGTANEVLNGIMLADRRPAMGIIPVGRGNDFAFGMGMADTLAGACAMLARGHRRTIDVGHVAGGDYPGGRYFGNGVGIGFDAIVGFEAAKLKRISGFAGYIVAALKTMALYHRGPVVTLAYPNPDGSGDLTLRKQVLMVSVMNGRRMGGGFMMAPDGDPGDGNFHLCVASQMRRTQVMGMIPHFMKGTQVGRAHIQTIKTPRITITATEGALPAHGDGETLCTAGHRLEMTLLPAQVEIVTQGPV